MNAGIPHEPPRRVEIDRLIHEPGRLVIMATLYVVEEADFVYVAQRTGLTPGNLNSHMARLVDGDYVAVKKTFAANRPRTVYSLTNEGRTAILQYRQQVGNLLALIEPFTRP